MQTSQDLERSGLFSTKSNRTPRAILTGGCGGAAAQPRAEGRKPGFCPGKRDAHPRVSATGLIASLDPRPVDRRESSVASGIPVSVSQHDEKLLEVGDLGAPLGGAVRLGRGAVVGHEVARERKGTLIRSRVLNARHGDDDGRCGAPKAFARAAGALHRGTSPFRDGGPQHAHVPCRAGRVHRRGVVG